MNTFKTMVLMALLMGLMVAVGGSYGGRNGAMTMLAVSLAMNMATYWFSDTMVLKSYGAREVSRQQAPELWDIVASLARTAELPMPKVCVINSETPNAFATGRSPDHAAVAVTTGIMRALSANELSGVLAHELSHIKHRDTLIQTVAASMAGVISFIANMAQWMAIFGGGRRGDDDNGGGNALGFLFTVIVAPIAAMLIQMSISRSREYEADKSGGELCGNPLYLASALERIEAAAGRMRMLQGATTATAHLFIINPLKGVPFASLFSTHPTTADRVARLREQAERMPALRGKR